MRSAAILVFLTVPCLFAGESAVLTSGSRLHADRHEIDGTKVRLYVGTGYIEMEASLVSGFEVDPAPPPPPSTPAPATVPEPTPAPPPRVLSPEELADAAADKYGLPPKLVRSVMHAESAFRPDAVSPKGAIGLMQLMPATAQTLGVDPYDPAQNVDAGARYLRELLLKYDGHLWRALAAYNAGAGAVEKYNGVPPFRETINYVKRIDREYNKQ